MASISPGKVVETTPSNNPVLPFTITLARSSYDYTMLLEPQGWNRQRIDDYFTNKKSVSTLSGYAVDFEIR
jgi:hypothetical protein